MPSETVQLGTRIPAKLHAELVRAARREGTSITHEVLVALRFHLDRVNDRRVKR